MNGDVMEMRASDQDREQVVGRLRAGLEDGRLQMEEYVERMGRAYQALTYADLAPLQADLPGQAQHGQAQLGQAQLGQAQRGPQGPAVGRGRPAVAVRRGLPTALRVLWTIWLTVVSINVVVWALVSVTHDHLAYPWPLWVAGPYGALLAAVSAGVIAIRRAA